MLMRKILIDNINYSLFSYQLSVPYHLLTNPQLKNLLTSFAVDKNLLYIGYNLTNRRRLHFQAEKKKK